MKKVQVHRLSAASTSVPFRMNVQTNIMRTEIEARIVEFC